ncbi:hypothetical protein ENUP19_0047G0034 [Entamoeba nuttalli]|uniref:MIF4G domain-containing protein n=2 Tax=Entamoeba nuttalli TaxID=412467 RepID=K2GU11_ENTNP|nr:hypothetical protein ENU1_163400 [Entamoeba nuttalli P19]EKE38523.1 hypothetical protein ENU1_163400 [Entamoeba nuttalli P19]|eukprot:XP_008859129.1 hypothetical protein ENU1_163400 [Entamoeba nuttalli P19]
MTTKTRHILILCDLQCNSPVIEKVGCNGNKYIYPPIKVGTPTYKNEYKTIHYYTPEHLLQLKQNFHSVSAVTDVFDKLILKRSNSSTPMKIVTAISENIDSTSFIRSSLNKLCQSNMSQILKELKTQVRTINDAKIVLDILFKKAVNEKKFTSLYVDFYKQLQTILLSTREEVGKEMPKILLDNAQHLFISIPEKTEEDQKTEEDLDIMKFEFLGNCRLISELYKSGLVKSALPVLCMNQLVNGGLIALEALAQLMSEIGNINQKEVKPIKDKIVQRVKEESLPKRYCIILENGLKALGFNEKLM